ncbi:MAG: flagellar hook-basal body complex protein [Oscillospiraceae bacterium]|nr:flagellar hook-basal body complex protein [Oscillospiraceae bacterium]
MVKSLYSGVSGLTTHQTRMDVIGNNIANVNSDGFKASKTTFRDIYYQGYRSATSGRATYAGNNPSQVGYGVQIGSIDKDMSQSGGRSTKFAFDMMLEGDGFFMTMTFDNLNLNSDKNPSITRYTRLGKFGVDSYGNVVASNNVFVVGSRNTLDGLLETGDNSGNALNDVEYVDRNDDGKITASDITYRNVINLDELMQQAYNVYTDEFGYMYGYDWDAILASGTGGGTGGNNTAGFAGVVYDEKKLEADGWTVTKDTNGNVTAITKATAGGTGGGTGGGTTTGTAITDEEKKKYVDIQETLKKLNAPTSNTDAKAAGAQFRYYVDNSGKKIVDEDGNSPVYSGGTGTGGGTGGAGGTTTTSIYDQFFNNGVPQTGDALKAAKAAAGNAGAIVGEVRFKDADALDIGSDGRIMVNYAGETKFLGRIDIAVFENPEGLSEDGNTQFAESAASGEAGLKRAGVDPGVTTTAIKSGYVEMSNVNLADEFSDMIITQRGFQANARIITTSDSMLEELVNLKR